MKLWPFVLNSMATESICRIHGYPSMQSRSNSALLLRGDSLAEASSQQQPPTLGTAPADLNGSSSATNLRYVGPSQLHGPHHTRCTADLHRSCFCVRFIAEHTRLKEESLRVRPHSSSALIRTLLSARRIPPSPHNSINKLKLFKLKTDTFIGR